MLHKLKILLFVYYCMMFTNNLVYGNEVHGLEDLLNCYIALSDKLEYLESLKNKSSSLEKEDIQIIVEILDIHSQKEDDEYEYMEKKELVGITKRR